MRRFFTRESALTSTIPSPARAHRMATALATVLAAGLSGLALVLTTPAMALAGPGGRGPEGRLTPQQKQQVFPDMKRLQTQDYRARIAILQKGERCMGAAGNADALMACKREERNAYRENRNQHRQAMEQMFRKYGIAMPEWGKKRRYQPGQG